MTFRDMVQQDVARLQGVPHAVTCGDPTWPAPRLAADRLPYCLACRREALERMLAALDARAEVA